MKQQHRSQKKSGLDMKKTITRRDFLNGAAIAVVGAGTVLPRSLLALEQEARSELTNSLSPIF